MVNATGAINPNVHFFNILKNALLCDRHRINTILHVLIIRQGFQQKFPNLDVQQNPWGRVLNRGDILMSTWSENKGFKLDQSINSNAFKKISSSQIFCHKEDFKMGPWTLLTNLGTNR